jgi:hypothetical protein
VEAKESAQKNRHRLATFVAAAQHPVQQRQRSASELSLAASTLRLHMKFGSKV